MTSSSHSQTSEIFITVNKWFHNPSSLRRSLRNRSTNCTDKYFVLFSHQNRCSIANLLYQVVKHKTIAHFRVTEMQQFIKQVLKHHTLSDIERANGTITKRMNQHRNQTRTKLHYLFNTNSLFQPQQSFNDRCVPDVPSLQKSNNYEIDLLKIHSFSHLPTP